MKGDMTVVLTVPAMFIPLAAFLAAGPRRASRGARLRGALCFVAAAVNWVAAVYTHFV